MPMKICNRCDIEKPIEDFTRKSTAKDGHNGYCRACKNLENKARRSRQRDRPRQWMEYGRSLLDDIYAPIYPITQPIARTHSSAEPEIERDKPAQRRYHISSAWVGNYSMGR